MNLSGWDILVYMQHHRVPTRLMDWTEVFGVAIHFALADYEPGGPVPCIWIMNPMRLNRWGGWSTDVTSPFEADLISPKYLGWSERRKKYLDYEDLLVGEHGQMNWERPVVMFPDLRNDRIHAQRGSFTIHGNISAPLDTQVADNPKPARLRIKRPERPKAVLALPVTMLSKVEIPHSAVDGARRYLKSSGIDHGLLFPDLEGLARSMRIKYGIEHDQVPRGR